ncbi:MAG: class B sortase [Eubacterium sp.]|nr:class B sortase [Eubacterium sp.]
MAENSNKKAFRNTVVIVLIIVFISAAVYLAYNFYNSSAARNEYNNISTLPSASSEAETLAYNPIDFASLQQGNDEVYAWIKIDGTNINYPVAQSSTDDAFYLTHSAVDKSYISSGAIYTEKCNSKDFSDRVTLVYGHNGYGDTMFTTLHNFEDEAFFNNNGYFNVYLPKRKLTYQVVSAFKYDDRHIMASFDFNNDAVFNDFREMIANPQSAAQNVRQELDTELDENSKILVLSTCISGDKSSRYLVCAVLLSDELTN